MIDLLLSLNIWRLSQSSLRCWKAVTGFTGWEGGYYITQRKMNGTTLNKNTCMSYSPLLSWKHCDFPIRWCQQLHLLYFPYFFKHPVANRKVRTDDSTFLKISYFSICHFLSSVFACTQEKGFFYMNAHRNICIFCGSTISLFLLRTMQLFFSM